MRGDFISFLIALGLSLAGCGAIQPRQPWESFAAIDSIRADNFSPTGDVPAGRSKYYDAATGTAVVKRSGSDIFFDGFIDERAVAMVLAELQRSPVNTLVIRSSGGYVSSGIKLGQLVRDAALVVVVYEFCGSTCANYVFTAGSKRVLNGLVVWHGSIEQKDFREYVLCGRQTSSLFGGAFPPLKRETRENWEEVRTRQAAFFQSIKVDEYITRAGQEPVFVEDGQFTYDIATMARFGVRDVTAWRDDYGRPEFCAPANKSGRRKLTCLIVTEEMLTYERTRREQGEECQADGTLRVRQ